MTTTTPLNPSLYQTLQAQFGDIRTTNAGQPQLSRRVPDPRRPGALTTQVSQRGEQYAFNCPFCGDERGRLYLSYLYGEKDASGSRNYNLWCCHNEKCQESKANRQILRSRLAQPIGRPAPSFNPQPAEQPPRREMLLPEGLIPIATLSAAHPATAYLLGRGFVLQELQELWEVAFCEWCCCWPRVPERIIIPVWRPAKLFAPSDDQSLVLGGWQARSIPGLGSPDEPKYLSAAGMKKSELLYGLHLAKQTQGPVFLVEGPTDCWRIGPGAVAIFGKDLSQTQKLLLVHHFAGRPILVMLDPDAEDAALHIQRELSLARSGSEGDSRVFLAELPPGREDPAVCSREELHALADLIVNNKLTSQGRAA